MDRDLSDVTILPDDGVLPLETEAARAALEAEGAYDDEPYASEPAASVGEVARSLKRGVEHFGQRLRAGDTRALRDDVEQAIRERPIGAMLVGAGIGFLAARLLRR